MKKDELSLDLWTVEELHTRCAEETAKFFQDLEADSRYCFELFKRAVIAQREEAWRVLWEQYYELVKQWIGKHPAFLSADEEIDYFVNRAFEKFWNRKFSSREFARFPNLSSILAYLKSCASSVLIDHLRLQKHEALLSLAELPLQLTQSSKPSVETEATSRMQRRKFWELLRVNIQDERDYLVIYASFVLGLKPADILSARPDLFTQIQDVYRSKERALNQLRRVVELSGYFWEEFVEIG